MHSLLEGRALADSKREPLLSIIVVVFRDRNKLAEILESVAPFTCEDLETIVIDGGSADGTVELLQTRQPTVDYWLSEPDHGIYDAMNKGLAAARGTYVLHLNADDSLVAVPWDVLRKGAAEKVDVICCSVLLDEGIRFVSRTSLLSRIDNTWHHQGTFYRRSSHLGYDTSYRTHADFDHNQRLMKKHICILEDATLVATHRGNGVTAFGTGHSETLRSIRKNYGIGYLLLARLRFLLWDLRHRWRTRQHRASHHA